MVGMSTRTIRKYIKQLLEQGYLAQRKNPKYKWDKTIQYRVDLYKIQLDLGKLGYALEGYRLLPNIQIVEEVEEIEEIENIEVDENKKDLPVGADKPKINSNTNSNNIICEDKDIIQDKNNKLEEIDIEKLAYESLKDNPIFNQLPPAAQQARLKGEINKIKILGLYS